MLDPYRMVAVNIISSFILLSGLLFYRFIFPKKKINLFFLLLLISILPIISIFRAGTYESGDFNIHIYRTMSFYDSLKEGIIMPSWAGNLNATYGYPLFIFNYTLPYYIVSLFHLLGFSFIGSMKIFLALNLVLSGIFMFLFTKKVFSRDFPAFTSSIFYIFAPYHLIDVHFKIVIGEILFFTILPLSFLFLYKFLHKKSILSLLLFALSFSALIMSHVVIALFAGILMTFYIFVNLLKNNPKISLSYIFASFFISLLISLYAWLGPLLLSKYSFIQNITLGTAYFPTLQDILHSPWRMGFLFQGPQGEISHLLGYVHLFVTIFLFALFCLKKIPKKISSEILFWGISFFITVFLILPYSKFIWESLPIIKIVGSHRLLIVTSFATSILAGYFIFTIKKQWLAYFLITIAIGSTILNWGQRRVIPETNDSVLRASLWKSTSEKEAHFYANTKWADVNNPWFSKLPNNHSEILTGTGQINDISRTSTLHRYAITANSPLKIRENTLYYPGWEARLNGNILPIYPDIKGQILLYIPKGSYNLELTYSDILTYRITKVVSLISFLMTLGYIIFSLSNKLHAKK